jgi:hypothetical protein
MLTLIIAFIAIFLIWFTWEGNKNDDESKFNY